MSIKSTRECSIKVETALTNLEKRAESELKKLYNTIKDPLREVLDELVRDSEEPTTRANSSTRLS